MKTVAVVAHNKKVLGGGLDELRRVLADRGYAEPLWYEAQSSRETPKLAKKAVAAGADLLFIWGGDGTVQRCVNAVVDCDIDLAILPAGTANLFANNLGVPLDIDEAVDIGLKGERRRLDVGVLNGRCFAVMAGIGFDAVMVENADGKLKDHFGRLAYIWTGAKAVRVNARRAKIRVDGELWFSGKTTCILIGQMGSVAGGVSVFPESRPDDGVVEVGVVTAQNAREWARVIARLALGNANRSPLTQMTSGRIIDIKLNRAAPFELDGGARKARKVHEVRVMPGAITVCVPPKEAS